MLPDATVLFDYATLPSTVAQFLRAEHYTFEKYIKSHTSHVPRLPILDEMRDRVLYTRYVQTHVKTRTLKYANDLMGTETPMAIVSHPLSPDTYVKLDAFPVLVGSGIEMIVHSFSSLTSTHRVQFDFNVSTMRFEAHHVNGSRVDLYIDFTVDVLLPSLDLLKQWQNGLPHVIVALIRSFTV